MVGLVAFLAVAGLVVQLWMGFAVLGFSENRDTLIHRAEKPALYWFAMAIEALVATVAVLAALHGM